MTEYKHDACDQAALDGHPEKMCDGCQRVPTTNQMDKTTNADRPKLVVQCANCGEWVFFTRGTHPMNATKGAKCVCGSEQFVPKTLISQRTFDPVKAKKETTAYLRKRKK